jgi:dihydrofolate reductase
MGVTAIVAYNKNFVIGDTTGNIPWHIPEDFKHFKQTTMGCPVIMGRVTYLTLPKRFRPLPGRVNILVSTRPLRYMNHEEYQCEDNPPRWFDEIENAIHHAQKEEPDKETFVIGGEKVYKYCVERKLLDRVLVSEVKGHTKIDAANYFPNLKELGWSRKLVEKFDEFSVAEFTPPTS